MARSSLRPGGAVLAVIVFVLMVKSFVLDAAIVDGRSMQPTFGYGSVVLVLRCAYGLRLPFGEGYIVMWARPRRGDIVAATSPRDGSAIVKRVAAVGPTTLAVAAERLLGPDLDVELSSAAALRMGAEPEIPEGGLFLIGDNPADSIDSRDYGPVPIERVSGKVLSFAGWAKR